MLKLLYILLYFGLFNLSLYSEEWYVVISKSCDRNETISIKNIYLKKQRWMEECSLLPLNLSATHIVRKNFMNNVLAVSKKAWTQYYDEMHFKGIDPPYIVNSPKSMLQYILRIEGAIGYIPKSLLNDKVHILLEFNNE